MYKAGWKSGRWSAICDRCGFRFHSDELIKEWDGLRVCRPCLEPRHPQDLIRIKSERVVPPWTRPESEDTFQFICSLQTASGYADLAAADCARADNTFFTYENLIGSPDLPPFVPPPAPFFFGSLYLDPFGIYFGSDALGVS